ncbi:MAG: hypothetical protein ACI81P_000821 [Neolewinella sp.]|jgi:hypothetical protein
MERGCCLSGEDDENCWESLKQVALAQGEGGPNKGCMTNRTISYGALLETLHVE